ncbi:MAG: hypothetical protein H7246_17575 [Phycisphaerae bacterium]|nr:hypothetical protein [Saprospiraceae bacterium]
MIATFISQPTAGQFDEKSFDLESVWKSTNWCWVKFTTDNGQEWVGAFRGTPVKSAVANKIKQAAILTDDCFYILDIDKKEVIFLEPQTEYKDLIAVPTNDIFLVATYYQIGLFDKDFNLHLISTEYNMDNITFKNYDGDILNIEWDNVPECTRVDGYVDTKDWRSVISAPLGVPYSIPSPSANN